VSADEASPAVMGSRTTSGQVWAKTDDPVRALQHALYRAAKADPRRRFHALWDKVTRRDVLWRAWVMVRRNNGAPGIDAITLADVEESGVARFLEELAVDLVETDIANCFEAIPSEKLMQAIEERVCDQSMLKLLRMMLRAGVMVEGQVVRSQSGTPRPTTPACSSRRRRSPRPSPWACTPAAGAAARRRSRWWPHDRRAAVPVSMVSRGEPAARPRRTALLASGRPGWPAQCRRRSPAA